MITATLLMARAELIIIFEIIATISSLIRAHVCAPNVAYLVIRNGRKNLAAIISINLDCLLMN